MTHRLLERVLARVDLADLDPAQRRLALRALVAEADPAGNLAAHVADLADAIDGLGPISSLMRDDLVTDVLVNSWDEIWIERGGRLEQTPLTFGGASALEAWVERVVGRAGARLDASQPITSARLPDGSRVHVVAPPVAPGGPVVSIRRVARAPLALDDLVAAGTLSPPTADRLTELVRERRSLLISGATGTGKTTLMNALLAHVPDSERVVTIEETPELRPACAHVVSLVGRDANVEGKGSIDLGMLLRSALRMRPDRIVVGEVRGEEAIVALSALSTGHAGSMLTVHADSGDAALRRMVDLALQGAPGLSEASLEAHIARAFDAVIHLRRGRGGARRLDSLLELR